MQVLVTGSQKTGSVKEGSFEPVSVLLISHNVTVDETRKTLMNEPQKIREKKHQLIMFGTKTIYTVEVKISEAGDIS